MIEAVGTQESMCRPSTPPAPGGHVGYVGVSHGVELNGLDLFFTGVHLHGGPAPVRRFLPELIQLIWDRTIDPGKVFDLDPAARRRGRRLPGDGRAARHQGAAGAVTEPRTVTDPRADAPCDHLGFCPDCEYLGDHPHPERRPPTVAARVGAAVVATVVFLTAIAPLATDMYVPAFPAVAAELSATATQVQLTLTTFFVGMALGQLVGGPVSDQRGRRTPLLAAIVAMTVASVVCAVSPTIAVLAVARLVQGFAGGWAMVIGRAVIIDLARGAQLVRVLNVIAAVGGIAPIVGPLLGAVILQLSHWRVSFWTVAALGVAMIIAVLAAVPETLPQHRPPRRRAADVHGREPGGAAQPPLRRLRDRLRVGDGCGVRLRRHVGVRAAVDERDVTDRLLDRLRRQRRRHDRRRPRSRPGSPAESPPARSSWSARSPPWPPGSPC